MAAKKDVVQGTLDLLVLRLLTREAMHGWGIMQRLRLVTDDVFQVTPGALFPSLQRLEDRGWTSSMWATSENNRRARYYAITKAGRKQLMREEAHWSVITSAVAKVLQEG